MIVYLATFPRSGNSLLQSLFVRNFRLPASQITSGAGEAPPIGRKWDHQVVEGRRMTYNRLGKRWPFIASGPLDYFTDAVRQELAALPEAIVLKTHFGPFDTYLPGEKVLQITRHPGPVTWSYFRYQADHALRRKKLRDVTVESTIEGDDVFGDWTSYIRRWRTASERMASDAYLNLRYERVAADAPSAVAQMSEFVGLPARIDGYPSFDDYSAAHPGADLRGTDEGYERFMTRSQLERLWTRHGAEASALGYTEPNYSLACGDEQIRRLAAQLDARRRN
jgi:hypothetical protein